MSQHSHENNEIPNSDEETFDSDRSLGEAAVKPLLPRHQDRDAWRKELRAVLGEAQLRRDTRSGKQVLFDWIKFRGNHSTPEE